MTIRRKEKTKGREKAGRKRREKSRRGERREKENGEIPIISISPFQIINQLLLLTLDYFLIRV
jgi:hypothetical protein